MGPSFRRIGVLLRTLRSNVFQLPGTSESLSQSTLVHDASVYLLIRPSTPANLNSKTFFPRCPVLPLSKTGSKPPKSLHRLPRPIVSYTTPITTRIYNSRITPQPMITRDKSTPLDHTSSHDVHTCNLPPAQTLHSILLQVGRLRRHEWKLRSTLLLRACNMVSVRYARYGTPSA